MNFRTARSISKNFLKAGENLSRCPQEKNGGLEPAPETHRNEFPAGYSLASCSSAELASAWPTALILKPTAPLSYHFSANGNLSLISVSHLKGSPQGLSPTLR